MLEAQYQQILDQAHSLVVVGEERVATICTLKFMCQHLLSINFNLTIVGKPDLYSDEVLECNEQKRITRIGENELAMKSSPPEETIAQIIKDGYQSCQNSSERKHAVIVDNWMHQLNVNNDLYRHFFKMIYEYPSSHFKLIFSHPSYKILALNDMAKLTHMVSDTTVSAGYQVKINRKIH